MEDFVLVRATLMRSNPQYIRELEIPADCGLDDLHKYLQLSCGRRLEKIGYTFTNTDGTTKQENELLFPGQEFWYDFGRNSVFRMRIEIIETRQRQEEDIYARVVGLIGASSMKKEIDSLPEFNQMQAYVEGSLSSYSVGYHIQQLGKEKLDLETVNNRIKRTYPRNTDSTSLIDTSLLNPSISAFPRTGELFYYTDNEALMDIVRYLGGNTYYGYYNRSSLIRMISRACGESDAVLQILLRLDVDEMNAFMKLCSGECTYQDIECFPVLTSAGLLKRWQIEKLVVPREFAQTAVELIQEENFEELYTSTKAVRVILIACCMLYGGCDRGMLKTFLGLYYPSLFIDDLGKAVDFAIGVAAEPKMQAGSGGFVVIPDNFRLTEARKLMAESSRSYTRYYPALAEMKRMAEQVYGFTDEQKKKIDDVVRKYVDGAGPTEYLYQYLDHFLRSEGNTDTASNYLISVIGEKGKNNSRMKDDVKNVMRVVFEDFRLPSLNGNTPREARHV